MRTEHDAGRTCAGVLAIVLAAGVSLYPTIVRATGGVTCKQVLAEKTNCRSVHARIYMTQGIPVRMWPVGTTRRLAVENENLDSIIPRWLSVHRNLYGDVTICPITPDVPGVMQRVCILDISNAVVEELGEEEGQQRVVFHVRQRFAFTE